MSGLLLCLDPAIGKTGALGVSLFKGQKLFAADIVRKSAKLGVDLTAQVALANEVIAWANAKSPLLDPSTYAVEVPRVYEKTKNKDPNVTLLPMQGVAAAVAALMGSKTKFVQYYPSDWKGTIDGDAMSARILSRLEADELEIVNAINPPGLRHNAIDAVGIGLYYLGRLTPRRVYPVD